MLTAEYDSRCRAHDAEERPVNWICFRGAHFGIWVIISQIQRITTTESVNKKKKTKNENVDGFRETSEQHTFGGRTRVRTGKFPTGEESVRE